MAWLGERGEEYAHAFDNPKVIRAAIDKTHVRPRRRHQERPGNRVFPAHDRRLAPADSAPPVAGLHWPHERHRPHPARAVRRRRGSRAKLTRGRSDVGAVVTFTGICRGDENGEPIAALTLEHYPGMAEAEIERHVAEAQRALAAGSASPSSTVTAASRRARTSCWWSTASSHRDAAFAAAEFLMDYLKTRAPFWKQVEQARRQNVGRSQGGRRRGGGRWTYARARAAE